MPCGMCKRRRRDPCPSKCRVGDCGRDKPVPPEKGDSLLHCGDPGGTRLSRPGSATFREARLPRPGSATFRAFREGRACRVRALRRSGRSGRDALAASGLCDVPGGTRFRIDMHCSEVKSRTGHVKAIKNFTNLVANFAFLLDLLFFRVLSLLRTEFSFFPCLPQSSLCVSACSVLTNRRFFWKAASMTVWRGVFGGGGHAPGRQRESRAPTRRDGADTAATSAALPCGAALFHFGTVPLGRYAACRRGSFARRPVVQLPPA